MPSRNQHSITVYFVTIRRYIVSLSQGQRGHPPPALGSELRYKPQLIDQWIYRVRAVSSRIRHMMLILGITRSILRYSDAVAMPWYRHLVRNRRFDQSEFQKRGWSDCTWWYPPITTLHSYRESSISLVLFTVQKRVREIELIFVGGAAITTARWSWKETKGGDGTNPTHPGMNWKDTWWFKKPLWSTPLWNWKSTNSSRDELEGIYVLFKIEDTFYFAKFELGVLWWNSLNKYVS